MPSTNEHKREKYRLERSQRDSATRVAGPPQGWELGHFTAEELAEVSLGEEPVVEATPPTQRPRRRRRPEPVVPESAMVAASPEPEPEEPTLEDIVHEVAEEVHAGAVGESQDAAVGIQSELPLEGIEPGTPALSPAVLAEYVSRVGEAMDLTTRGRSLTPTQKATLERVLSDEDSLLRMWCDGRFEEWEEDVVIAGNEPPMLISGVLADQSMTFGADWELPLHRPIDQQGRTPGTFQRAFEDMLGEKGLTVYHGNIGERRERGRNADPYPRVQPGGVGEVFSYSAGQQQEYGFAVANDDPDGWQYVNNVFAAINDVNQGKGAERVPGRAAVILKGDVERLMAVTPAGRFSTGWHIHISAPYYGNAAVHRATFAAFNMNELAVMRLGQHKELGWRKSTYTGPPSQGGRALDTNGDIHTMEFRPNDTYVKTDDPGATFRRFQAQAALYSGMFSLANKPAEGHDYTITGDGDGTGLKVGFATRGAAKQRIEKMNFLAALDLFAHRKAKTADGQDYDVRRLVFYEWATSKPVASRPSRTSIH